MLKTTILTLAILFALICPANADQGPDIQEGEWKITVNFDMPGMPMAMPPITYNQCISKEDPIPKNEKPNQVCKTKDVTTKGNTVNWTIACTNRGGEMTGNGTITYAKDKMKGTMTMEADGVKMKSQYTGERIGVCKSE